MTDLTLKYTSERDMDLLFIEEFRCSHEFLQLFLNNVAIEIPDLKSIQVTARQVRHSVDYKGKTADKGKGAGESDIVLKLSVPGPYKQQQIELLVENKIDAAFQPEQPGRYGVRAKDMVDSGKCDKAYSVLIAPNEYLETVAGVELFHASVSYESLLEYFDARSQATDEESRLRFLHKKELVEQSILKCRRGYAPEFDAVASSFWTEYYVLSKKYPTLHFKKPDDLKPAGSTWAIFSRACEGYANLPRCTIKHKLNYGRVDLEFAGWASYFNDIAPELNVLIELGMQLRKAGKSFAVSIDVPEVNIMASMASQEKHVREGMDEAVRLQNWYRKESKALQGLSEYIKHEQ